MSFYEKALRHMGYDAAAMGEREAYFINSTGRTDPYGDGLPLLCANVVVAATGEPISGTASVVKHTAGGLSVGVTAVLGDNLMGAPVAGSELPRITAPAEALRSLVAELRKTSDLVVVLSHTGYDAAKQLASQVQGIDVMLAGHASGVVPGQVPERVGKTFVMPARSNGTHLGKLALDILEDKSIKTAAGEFVALGKEVADDPEVAKLVAEHDKDWTSYIASLRAPVSTSSQEYQPREPRPYVSAFGCRKCHREVYESWIKTRHGRAFESLRDGKRTEDPECLPCHTTAFKSAGGFISESKTPQFRGVGCESCHGPGVIHERRPGKGYGAVLPSACTQCHDATNSPGFDYEKRLRMVRHSGA